MKLPFRLPPSALWLVPWLDLLEIAGLVLILVGIAGWSLQAAAIAAGLVLLAVGVLIDYTRPEKEKGVRSQELEDRS